MLPTPAESKVATSRRIRAAAWTSGTARTAPEPSPSRRSRSKGGVEVLEGRRRPGLLGPVPRDEVCRDTRAEGLRHKRGGAGDDPVEEDGGASGRGPEQEADEAGVLEPTDRREGLEGPLGCGSVVGDPAADHLDLVDQHGVVAAGAATGDLGGVPPGEDRDERRRCGGVADAEVTGDQEPVALLDEVLGDLDTDLDRRAHLVRRHRRTGREVVGAVGDPAMQDSGGGRADGPRDPTSTTTTSAWALRPRALITAPPATMLATIWTVTSCGQGETPCAWTPWSPAKTATATGAGSGGGHAAYTPLRRTPSSSSTPIEPRGLVRLSCRARAAAMEAPSGGSIAATVDSRRGAVEIVIGSFGWSRRSWR